MEDEDDNSSLLSLPGSKIEISYEPYENPTILPDNDVSISNDILPPSDNVTQTPTRSSVFRNLVDAVRRSTRTRRPPQRYPP